MEGGNDGTEVEIPHSARVATVNLLSKEDPGAILLRGATGLQRCPLSFLRT